MLIGTALTSRVSPTTGYALGIALPMLVFGIGQGLGLSTLTTAGLACVAPRDAGVAGALVNVAHHLGGALGLGILITVFGAAGPGQHGPLPLAERVFGIVHRRLRPARPRPRGHGARAPPPTRRRPAPRGRRGGRGGGRESRP